MPVASCHRMLVSSSQSPPFIRTHRSTNHWCNGVQPASLLACERGNFDLHQVPRGEVDLAVARQRSHSCTTQLHISYKSLERLVIINLDYRKLVKYRGARNCPNRRGRVPPQCRHDRATRPLGSTRTTPRPSPPSPPVAKTFMRQRPGIINTFLSGVVT